MLLAVLVFKNCASFFLFHANQKCTIRKKYQRRYKANLYERVKRRVFSELYSTKTT